MKQRILLVVAMLLLVMPAFARVNITIMQGTGADANKLTVRYDCNAGEAVRAFALNFSLGSANNSMIFSSNPNDINDFNRGESNKPGGGYGIFPGQFNRRIDPGSPNWYAQYYSPVAPDNEIDSNGTGMGYRTMIAEMGSLYKDLNAPGASGTLFTIRVDANSKTSDTLNVSASSIRGGIVLEDGTTATNTNLPISQTISFAPPAINIAGDVNLLNLTGRQVPYDANLTVQIYSGATLVETLIPKMTYGGTQGICHYSTTCVVTTPGTYDIKFKASHWLRKAVLGVTLVSGDNTVSSINSLINGDVNGDNQITSADFGALRTNYLKVGDNLAGDLNEDGQVTSVDFGILRTNYLKVGD
jgi:hypothetical protein